MSGFSVRRKVPVVNTFRKLDGFDLIKIVLSLLALSQVGGAGLSHLEPSRENRAAVAKVEYVPNDLRSADYYKSIVGYRDYELKRKSL
jgi:hypothetical protein